MYNPQPQPIYETCKQPWDRVAKAVVGLWQHKAKLVAKEPDVIKRMYEYIEIIYQAVISKDDTLSEEYDRQVIKFLDVDLIDKFIQNPNNRLERNVLSGQLVFVCAALHSFDITPYDKDELSCIAQGTFDDYDDIVFAYSLREIINKQTVDDYAVLFLPWLYNELANNQMNLYTWEEALLFSLILDMVWLGFINMTDRDKKFLLQNYFFLGIVCGVPVRQMLKMVIGRLGSSDYKQKYNLFLNFINKNNELVPINLEKKISKQLVEIAGNYYASAISDEISGFNQEKFIAELYRNQPDRDLYMPWIREAINILAHIRNFSLL